MVTPSPLLYTQYRHSDRGKAHNYHKHTHVLPHILCNHRHGEGASWFRRLWGKCCQCSDVLRGIQKRWRVANRRQGWWAGRLKLSRRAPSLWPRKKTKSPTTPETQSKLPVTHPPCTMALAGVVIIFVNFLSTVC